MAITLKVTTVGSAGAAAGTSTSALGFTGYIEAIRLDYHVSAPATTDLTIAETSGLGRTLLAISNSATDAVYYPRPSIHSPTGVASATGVDLYYLDGSPLSITVVQSDALTNAVVVTIQIRNS